MKSFFIEKCENFLLWIQNRSVSFWMTGILIFSFLLKFWSWSMEPTVSRDGCLYIRFVQIWYDTGSFQCVLQDWPHFWLPPLPFFLMKCLMHAGLSAEHAGVLLNMGLGTFTPMIAYGIAIEVTRKKGIALGSALLVAVSPAMNALSIEIQRDMVYLFFAGLTIWFFVSGIRRQTIKYWFFAGLACGCSLLSRFETLEFLVIVPVFFVLMCITKHLSWKKGLTWFGCYIISMVCIIFTLSFVMQTMDYIFPNYEFYYQRKLIKLKRQIEPELRRSPK